MRRIAQNSVLSSAMIFALSGCSIPQHNTAVDAETELVGLEKADLYQCAGVPDRTAMVDGHEFVTFDNSEEVSQALTIPIFGGGASDQETQFCRTTARIDNGRVTQLSYVGDNGPFYATKAQCAYSINTCVRLVEQRRKQSPAPASR